MFLRLRLMIITTSASEQTEQNSQKSSRTWTLYCLWLSGLLLYSPSARSHCNCSWTIISRIWLYRYAAMAVAVVDQYAELLWWFQYRFYKWYQYHHHIPSLMIMISLVEIREASQTCAAQQPSHLGSFGLNRPVHARACSLQESLPQGVCIWAPIQHACAHMPVDAPTIWRIRHRWQVPSDAAALETLILPSKCRDHNHTITLKEVLVSALLLSKPSDNAH